MKKITIIIFCLFLIECNPGKSLETYANELELNSIPKKPIFQYLSSFESMSSAERLKMVYYEILSKWSFEKDFLKNDIIKNCNDIIETKTFKGDCDDFSALLMSFCRALEINAVFCLGRNKKTETGHIWIEVEICNHLEFNNEIEKKIKTLFNSDVNIIARNNYKWLQLNPFEMLEQYDLEYIVNEKGKLIKI